MQFELLACALSFHRRITARLRKVAAHLLVEEFEPVDLVYGILRRFDTVENDEGLALSLQTLLRDDVDHIAVFREDSAQGLDQCF